MTLLNPKYYSKQKSHLKTVHRRLEKNVFRYINQSKDQFWLPLKNLELNQKDKFNIVFYVTYELFNLISLFELTKNLSDESDFGEEENLLFDEWNKGDFRVEFSNLIKKGYSIKKASATLLPLYRNSLLSIYKVHILGHKQDRFYRFNFELGDMVNHRKIQNHFPEQNEFIVHQKRISYLGQDKKQIQRIEHALDIIYRFSPDSFKRFFYFTDVIIPTKNNEIVSYSSQFLPAYSIINLYNRDDVDLLDDLLHENGHHHLNTYLHEEDILNEDDELIYYSPWRKELRPVRGIYHAFATFFWAFQLFKDLENNIDKLDFSQKQIAKIHFRLCEEFLMLKYCVPDLKHCYQHKKITKKGMLLVKPLLEQILKYDKQYPKVLAKLTKVDKAKIIRLEKLLKSKRIIYSLKKKS